MTDLTATIPTIAQLRENSLSGVVRHEIERLILSGELPTGSRVNENAISLRLGVSRGPVREACRALVELGLLHLIPNRGVFVRRMDRHDVEEVYDLRAGLTGLAGSLLAVKITDAEVERLRTLVAEMDKAVDAGDFRRFYPINLEFHDVILQLTGNSRLIRSYRALVKEFQLFLAFSDELRRPKEDLRAAWCREEPPRCVSAFRGGNRGRRVLRRRLRERADQIVTIGRIPILEGPSRG